MNIKFIEDIVILKDDVGFIIIMKVKLLERGETSTEVDLTKIYSNGGSVPVLTDKLMSQFSKDMKKHGLENFLTYRHCDKCDKLFVKTNKSKITCSKTCRVAKHRASKKQA